MNKMKLWEIFLYLLFGIIGTILNIILFYILSQKFYFHYIVSNFFAWLFSIIFAFVTNKIWVFNSKSWGMALWIKEFLQFILARIGTCAFDMVFMFISISLLKYDETISKIIANVFVVIINYICSKLWIFNNRTITRESKSKDIKK